MKCYSKSVMRAKHKLDLEEKRKLEEARWNSLTPEEQEAELIKKEEDHRKAVKALNNLGAIMGYINGPYSKL